MRTSQSPLILQAVTIIPPSKKRLLINCYYNLTTRSFFLQNMQKLSVFYWNFTAAYHDFAWRAGSLKWFLYIILNISSTLISLMKSFILKWCDAAFDVDVSLTTTRLQLIKNLLSQFIFGPTIPHPSLTL